MDQNLDIQLAALIFLAGTQSLGSEQTGGAVEQASETSEESADDPIPAPTDVNGFNFPYSLNWNEIIG